MSTLAVVAPFDLFGNAGTGAGAQLLADALREMLADNRRERQPARCRAYERQLSLQEFEFETLSDYQNYHRQARQIVKSALKSDDFLLWLGGNHLSVLPVLEVLGGMTGAAVVQFDAHFDVYNLTGCTTKLSHGNFLLHAQGPLSPIVHVGHRDLFLAAEHISKHFRSVISAQELATAPEKCVASLMKFAAKAKHIWIDIDCDVFDPAFFPAVCEPLPFGIAPAMFLRLLDAFWSPKVMGLSISEFKPARDVRDQSLAVLVWLIEYVLLKRYEKGKKNRR
ncbi:MAG TPA: arginase family protein [Gemmataceae bacterium]|nr:arginase family protein [Gemmataceae bacterium]